VKHEVIEVELVAKETDLAFLFEIDGMSPIWVPKSVIDDPDEIGVGDESIEVGIAAWFASKEGIV
jgi:hypothetical protein